MKKLLTFMAVLVVAFAAFAQKQSPQDIHREFREFKIKYLSEQIKLDSKKASEFAELYSQLEKERHDNFAALRKIERTVKGNKNATDEDYARLAEAISKSKTKDAEITSRFDEKLSKILSPRQIIKLKEAEDTFRAKMKQIRQNHKDKKK